MNDQPNNWEADWREELTGYEAPLQPGDWANMEGLLDGGAPAPPEPPAMSAAKASTTAAIIKNTLIALVVISAAGLGYWWLSAETTPELAVVLPAETTENAPAVVDTLPPGYQYNIMTYRKLDRNGKVLSVKYDTSIVPVQYRMDTVYQTDEKGNLYMRIDTAIIPVRSVRARPIFPPPKRSGGGTSFNPPPALPAEITNLAPPTPPAARQSRNLGPAAAPPPPPPPIRVTPPSVSPIQRSNYSASRRPSKPPRERSVTRLDFQLLPELSGYDEYFQLRLQQIIQDHPVKIIPVKTYNGYFPAYREGFN